VSVAATSAPQEGAPINRTMITISIMLATIIQALDGTIANVALPHMQGSLSASSDQITWVLTSFIVAAAIATPLNGWLVDRFGLKNVFLVSVAGFWCRCRRPSCSTLIRAKSTARRWPCGAWA
jgi:DHA2 family multidrug resistance protein